MSRTICFTDKETGMSGICTMEGLDEEQIQELFKDGIIDCEQCSFFKTYKGKEKENFSYTNWGGGVV